jgi:hypothetical protein
MDILRLIKERRYIYWRELHMLIKTSMVHLVIYLYYLYYYYFIIIVYYYFIIMFYYSILLCYYVRREILTPPFSNLKESPDFRFFNSFFIYH